MIRTCRPLRHATTSFAARNVVVGITTAMLVAWLGLPCVAGELPVSIDVEDGTLHGTLTLPDVAEAVPLAILVAGSGPTDRDGNAPALGLRTDTLKQVAEALNERGIAALRYDKRGVGRSANAGLAERDMRFDHYVHDVVAWAEHFADDERFESIFIVGHSEGATLGLVAATRTHIDGLVCLAGTGWSAGDLLRDQLQRQLPDDLMAEAEGIIVSLEAGQTVENVPPALLAIFRPSVQPYLISWFQIDPLELAAQLERPVLMVAGTFDIQVPLESARTLADHAPDGELLAIDDMNHILKQVPAGDMETQQRSYTDPSLPLAEGLADALAAFLSAHAP